MEPGFPLRRRVAISLAIGLASALFAGYCLATAGEPSDFEYWWRAARVLRAGGDPYAMRPGTAGWPLGDPFFYPLPALFPVLPLSFLPLPVAGALFMGISGALLAFAVTRDGLHRLWLFASGPYVMALKLGQCSPILIAAALLPSLGWLLPWKPQIGLPVFAYRPSVRAAILAVVAAAASFLVRPTWLAGRRKASRPWSCAGSGWRAIRT